MAICIIKVLLKYMYTKTSRQLVSESTSYVAAGGQYMGHQYRNQTEKENVEVSK